MEKQQLLNKLTSIIEEVVANRGPVTDIWLPAALMEKLDERDILERLYEPYKIGDTIITHHVSSEKSN